MAQVEGRVTGRERTVAEEGAGKELSRGTSRREPARRAGTKQRADSEAKVPASPTFLSHDSPAASAQAPAPPAPPLQQHLAGGPHLWMRMVEGPASPHLYTLF